MGVGNIFSRGAIAGFSRGGNSGEISFYLLKTKRIYFSTKKSIGKHQISKSRGASSLLPTPMSVNSLIQYCLSAEQLLIGHTLHL